MQRQLPRCVLPLPLTLAVTNFIRPFGCRQEQGGSCDQIAAIEGALQEANAQARAASERANVAENMLLQQQQQEQPVAMPTESDEFGDFSAGVVTDGNGAALAALQLEIENERMQHASQLSERSSVLEEAERRVADSQACVRRLMCLCEGVSTAVA